MHFTRLLDTNAIPDALIRVGIRRIVEQRLRDEDRGSPEQNQRALMDFVSALRSSPIAVNTADANAQHYEVPAEFFEHVLGKHLKYSSGYWPDGVTTLDGSEEAMLRLTADRARVDGNQDILELGCGWGSLTLYLAARFPSSRITAVSNSRSQKAFIDGRARERGLNNVEVITADINTFTIDRTFDRVVSVEMFEHMRNYAELLRRISTWLQPGGFLFVHIFSHLRFAYPYEVRDESDWMAKHFFTGGIMPSNALLLYFQEHLHIANQWLVDGTHYQRTSEAWLARMDAREDVVMRIFCDVYGKPHARRWWVMWRVFFMACAELFGHKGGSEWMVSHHLFRKPE